MRDGQKVRRQGRPVVSGRRLVAWSLSFFLLALTLAAGGCSWGGRAAGGTGRLTGQITDARTGAPLPAAVVTVDGVAYRAVEEGVYATNLLPYGTHAVKVEAPGYYAETAAVSLESSVGRRSFALTVIPDTTTPTVRSTTPATGATGVYLNAALVIRFSEAMDAASVQAALRAEPAVAFRFTWSGTDLVAAPDPSWAANTTYTVTLGTAASDPTGNHLAAPVVVAFTTGATTIPQAAFASNGDDPYGKTKLYFLNPEAPSSATPFTVGDYLDEQPTWSPDRVYLAFVSTRQVARRLYISRADAYAPQPLLPFSQFEDWEPKWSPDGRRLAFASNRLGRFNLFAVRVDPASGQADQASVMQITQGMNWDSCPDWSPDSNLLVFSSDRGAGERLLYAVDVEDLGGALGEVAGRTVSLLTPGDPGADQPAWSPDGTKIAYTSEQAGTKDIWVMEVTVTAGPQGRVVTAQNHRRLTTDAGSATALDEQPAWTPDGRYLLFVSDRAGTPDIYRLDMETPGAAPVCLAAGAGKQTNPALPRR
jgi:hypothetical protein